MSNLVDYIAKSDCYYRSDMSMQIHILLVATWHLLNSKSHRHTHQILKLVRSCTTSSRNLSEDQAIQESILMASLYKLIRSCSLNPVCCVPACPLLSGPPQTTLRLLMRQLNMPSCLLHLPLCSRTKFQAQSYLSSPEACGFCGLVCSPCSGLASTLRLSHCCWNNPQYLDILCPLLSTKYQDKSVNNQNFFKSGKKWEVQAKFFNGRQKRDNRFAKVGGRVCVRGGSEPVPNVTSARLWASSPLAQVHHFESYRSITEHQTVSRQGRKPDTTVAAVPANSVTQQTWREREVETALCPFGPTQNIYCR